MQRTMILFACTLTSISCSADGERLTVPPLPQDGTALPYSQVLGRLAAQTNSAKEEHFLNHWDGVADAATALEQSGGYLLKAPDLPPAHKAAIEKASRQLNGDIVKLRDAARRKDQSEALELIRRLHNQIRDLQDMK
jgi:hypothetical protein